MNKKNSLKNIIIASTAGILLSILFIVFIGEFFFYQKSIFYENSNSGHWIFIHKLYDRIEINKKYLYQKNNQYYLSRCIALSGDSLEIKNAYLVVNQHKKYIPQTKYIYEFTSKKSIADTLHRYQIDFEENNLNGFYTTYAVLNNSEAQKLNQYKGIYKTKRKVIPLENKEIRNIDFFEKIKIPKKNDTILFDSSLLAFYSKIANPIFKNKNGLFYFVAQNDYFFMLNDIRNCTHDSRTLGLIQKKEIIGSLY